MPASPRLWTCMGTSIRATWTARLTASTAPQRSWRPLQLIVASEYSCGYAPLHVVN